MIHPCYLRGLTLLELLMVLAIIGVIASVALPSWRSVQQRGVVSEARTVLQRLDLKQKQHWQRDARYAVEAELPSLAALSDRVAAHYQLNVQLTPGGYRLQLLSRSPDLPSLNLTHLGLWGQSFAEASSK